MWEGDGGKEGNGGRDVRRAWMRGRKGGVSAGGKERKEEQRMT